jgi:hypothetical protein
MPDTVLLRRRILSRQEQLRGQRISRATMRSSVCCMQQSERIRVLVRQRSAKCVRMARNDASSLGSLAEAAAATLQRAFTEMCRRLFLATARLTQQPGGPSPALNACSACSCPCSRAKFAHCDCRAIHNSQRLVMKALK